MSAHQFVNTQLCTVTLSPPLLTGSISNISKEDLAKHAQRLMASIRIYAGIDTVGGFFVATDKV